MACMLHLAFATGTEPGKWFQRFQRDTPHGLDAVAVDDPFAALYDGSGPDGLGGSGPDGADHKADYETDHEAGVGEGGVSEVTADLALMRLPDKRSCNRQAVPRRQAVHRTMRHRGAKR